MLIIASPNTDRSLLTIAELRVAAGLQSTDGSQDAKLQTLGNYVAAAITQACSVAKAGVVPPTLRQETVTETFRFKSRQGGVFLARKPIVEVLSVNESGSAIAESDYEIDGQGVYRISGECRTCWACGEIIVEYTAGYAIVPDDLKWAASKFVQAELAQGARDPLLKSVSIEGVSTREYWVDPTKDSVVPGEVMDILERGGYVTKWGWLR